MHTTRTTKQCYCGHSELERGTLRAFGAGMGRNILVRNLQPSNPLHRNNSRNNNGRRCRNFCARKVSSRNRENYFCNANDCNRLLSWQWASHFLSRLPNNIGTFLGLAENRLKGWDNYCVGIATHFVTSQDPLILLAELNDIRAPCSDTVDKLLAEYHRKCFFCLLAIFPTKSCSNDRTHIFRRIGRSDNGATGERRVRVVARTLLRRKMK